jgi:dolichol kinase
VALKLHRDGRFRRWLGARFGGDEALGDRLWRRFLHLFGAAVLLYYPLPNGFFVVVPKVDVLLAALAAVLVVELLRHTVGLSLPTIRPYEAHRVGSYAVYAIALVGAVLFFPVPIAAAVVLGTAIVDPLAGEVRALGRSRGLYPGLPLVAYGLLAFVGLRLVGGWPLALSAGLAILAAPVAIAVEYPKIPWSDDDLAMTFAPALVLYAVGVVLLGLPG